MQKYLREHIRTLEIDLPRWDRFFSDLAHLHDESLSTCSGNAASPPSQAIRANFSCGEDSSREGR